MKLESEHFLLLAGIFFILIGLIWFKAFIAGIIICILSYAIDLCKRVEDEVGCPFCGELPETLKEQAE